MKLCINSQDLQDFILTRLDLMKDMRKKGRKYQKRMQEWVGVLEIAPNPYWVSTWVSRLISSVI
jgi:hypothetical protein